MKEHRIYTDPRYVGIEVHNDGDARFRVVETASGRVLDSFAGSCQAPVSEESAGKRAQVYFERMAGEDRQIIAEMAQAADAVVAQRTGRDFSDEQVVCPDTVLDAWEQAQAMEDSPEKAARLQQVRAQAAQLETAAEQAVRELLA